MKMAGCYSTTHVCAKFLRYSKEELDLCDTRKHWHDLAQRERIIKQLRESRCNTGQPSTNTSVTP